MTNLPAHLANRQNRRSVADAVVANIPSGQGPHISILGNRFTRVFADGDKEPVTTVDPKTGLPFYDCVIVDALERPSRIYYEGAYDPGDVSPPACWSDNGVAPSRACSNPQHITCGGCPKQEWGSAISAASGKGIPACRHNQKLALFEPGDDDTVFLLRVPPNSLKNLAAYLKKFRGQAFSEGDVITRISFEPDVLGTLTFRAIGHIDQKTMAFCDKVLASKATDELVGRLDLPREGAMLPAPAQQGRITGDVPGSGYTEASRLSVTGPASQTTTTAVQADPAPATGARRGRKSKAQAEPAGGPLDTAPFRPSPAPATASTPPANGQFGIAQGTEPNPELQAAIDDMFGPA